MDRQKYLDKTEAKAMIAQAVKDGGIIYLVVDMALQTGLRVSELVKIQVEQIDFKRGCILVERNKKKVKAWESLPISSELKNHLVLYLRTCKDRTGPLFIGRKGPLTIRGLQQIWNSCRERAGLPKGLSIHSARHTMATHLMTSTGNLRLVQKQLGHASPVTTANMYAQVPFSAHQEALNDLYGKKNRN